MRILGILPPPSKVEHQRARAWAASGLAALVLLMLMLLIGSPPPDQADLMPTALRPSRIAAFQTEIAACRAALSGAGFRTERVPDVSEANGCGYRDAVRLIQSEHAYSGPVLTSCAAAAALVLWERDVVRPAARARYGQAVARINLAAPSYQCRRIAGRRDRRLSEHARANAIDIEGFTLENGRTVTVAEGWRGLQRDRAFLRDVRDGACAYFQAVLSPDYNRAHRDHLHFDLGRDHMCR
ncbi:MAG: extensin family protein [Hyphomonadaceae bacterium]